MMEYKGYIGHVEYDDEAMTFHGEIINTQDVITFQGESVETLKREFEKSVDVYLAFCAKLNKEPNKPFSGKLMVRMKPELHRAISIAAKREKTSLNALITQQLEQDFGLSV